MTLFDSFTAPPPSGGGRGPCFPSFAKVKIENGNSVRMSDLKLGERVQTGTNINKDGLIIFM